MSNDIPDALFKRLVLANQYRILSFLDVDNEHEWRKAVDQSWVAEVQLQSETGLKLPLSNVLNFTAEHGCPRNLSSLIK